MKKHLFLPIVIAVLTTLPVVAQDHGPPAGGSDKDLKDSTSDVKGRSNEIERVKRDLEKPESETTTSAAPPGFSQIKEDFERIQIINSDVLQVNASSGLPAYERIAEAAAEMEKRAVRLKTNLFAPKPVKQAKEKAPSATEQQELKALLPALDKAIADFTHSPIFQGTGVANAADIANAQKELEKVINFSGDIKVEADRLKKVNSPAP
jgi:hypothetical protein